ncbi:diaminopimelate epimerase [Rarobacter incanus]|uniref:Diaminopimelate epimerase n=1 Tax=Rarobacter incanus TaxID=153494 RepID=A0A542SLH9_9MICO|nr:diaminopimelate epimerase [Rarobacter incanus]TQK75472.1 diaminopimelate epimerase [Rarobacter incanus]
MTRIQAAKGHGTKNDFVLVFDPHGDIEIDESLVRKLTDRRAGIGGDGLIRLIRTDALGDEATLQGDATWFMDYRNADGSIAQMCGNGVRVVAAFYEHLGLGDVAREPLAVGTRAGVKTVTKDSQSSWYSVDMGPASLTYGDAARSRGADSEVVADGLGMAPRAALSVDMGNPHTVVALATPHELVGLDLGSQPAVTPVPKDGSNVEFAAILDPPRAGVGHASMRVFERGVGETQSCGTGACAVAVALHEWGGPSSPRTWRIDVPGGSVEVDLSNPATVVLSGPARIVADLDIDLTQLG